MTIALRTFSLASLLALSAATAACGDDDDEPGAPIQGSGGAGGSAGSGGGAGASGGAGGAVASYDAVSYDLRGSFDWARQRLVANEAITVSLNDAAGPQAIELDADVAIMGVRAGGAELPFSFDAARRKLRVDLAGVGGGAAERSFEVAYEAKTSVSLLAYQGRDDDPVKARVVSTDSEPADGVGWLVAHHHPSDRALWKVELTVEPDEDVVANGARVADEAVSGKRRVRYEMAQPLPTYLMAFAAGQLDHADRTTGRVPLSVWHRRGAPVEAERHLDLLAELMATFEPLVGDYPWDRYAVVLLPQQPGGMENATITFNAETSGQGEIGYSLNAHELAHQWFGDWVTMRDYDDAWVKEGMATLLAAEADRARLDLESKGRLLGRTFPFNPDDAIVDRALTGQDKYTSGPYSRAAWLITQIRAKVGEEAFWASLRGVLAQHALGDVDGETFLRAFAPALDEVSLQKALATLEQKPPPSFGAEATPGETGNAVKLTLSDPSGALLAPVALTVVDAVGAATPYTLAPGAPLEIVVPAGGYLAPDEGDVHPGWRRSFRGYETGYDEAVASFFWPQNPAALAAALSRSAAHQEVALYDVGLPSFVTGPAEFAPFYAGLDSRNARSNAEFYACYALQSVIDTPEAEAWAAAIAPALAQPAISSFSTSRAGCGVAFATATFGAEFALASTQLSAANAARFSYLLSFDYGAGPSFDAAARAATTAPSLLVRDRAISRLAAQASLDYGFTPVPDEQIPAWRAFFRDRLAEVTSPTRFEIVWQGVFGLRDDAALALTAEKLHSVDLSNERRGELVCEAFLLSEITGAGWDAFRDAAQPWDTLGPDAAAALADPSVCPSEDLRAASRTRRVPARPAFREPADSPALRARRR